MSQKMNQRINQKINQIGIGSQENIFVLTGAGISAESGIPTFRSGDNSTWSGHKIEDVCTPQAWERDPWKVWQFYSERRGQVLEANPNPAHMELASLERGMKGRFFLCTQNVDNLHEAAGSQNILHIHGELFKSRCEFSCSPPILDCSLYTSMDELPVCPCGALMRPHIVFFGEQPLGMDLVGRELDKATMLLVVGTSGSVYPANTFAAMAQKRGLQTIYVGLEPPSNKGMFSDIFLGKASEMSFVNNSLLVGC